MSKARRTDTRTLDVLIATALTEAERQAAGEQSMAQGVHLAIVVLQERGTRDVLDAALSLCKSDDAQRRKLGAEILGQLGWPERTFPEERCDALLALVQQDPELAVIIQAIYALGHLGHARAVPALAALQNHADGEVRRGVAFSLCGHETPEAASALVHLARDRETEVRDWATTGIAQSLSIDGPPIRTLLLERAVDEDGIIRAEALSGLALRRDSRMLPHLRAELIAEQERPYLFIDAAKAFLGWSDDRDASVEELLAALDNAATA
ncbi:HEAT repeat domain-containing protein [Hypericibacter sp.]|uniref:HEAT repeat domain-containing protein n=1 Tax=Hypericibacter sp. TaxID=2705401 RepID=UPI003D6CB343